MALAGPGWYVNTSVLHLPGRNVNRYCHSMAAHLLRSAVRRCPVGYRWHGPTRPAYGILRLSHSVDVDRVGPETTEVRLVNDAPYALFVHEGTHGPIVPDPSNEAGRFYFSVAGQVVQAESVRGQAPQPWMEDAMGVTMRRFTRAGG